MPDFRHGIPALEKLKLNSIIRRLQASDDAPAPDTAADETPLTLLPFADAAPISSGADLTAWLTALPDSARPIAIALDDTVLTCAAQDLSCCQAGTRRAICSLPALTRRICSAPSHPTSPRTPPSSTTAKRCGTG